MKELCSFGPWMKCNVNILYYVFKFPIMLEIILCYNKDIIPTWRVRKSVSQLTYFEKNYIFACYGWYEFCMNKRINCSIIRPASFVKTWNEKLKWNTDVYVRICRYDVYEYMYMIFFLWGCYVMKLHEVRVTKILVICLAIWHSCMNSWW